MRFFVPFCQRTGALGLVVALLLPMRLAGELVVSNSDGRGVSFRYEPGEIELKAVDSGAVRVMFPDGENLAPIDGFDLPVKLVRVGMPQSGGIRLSTRTGPVERIGGVNVARAIPSSQTAPPPKRGVKSLASTEDIVEVGPTEVLRGVRFVELRIRPARYDPQNLVLTLTRWVEVELRFEQSPTVNSRPDLLDGCVSRLLLNGDIALDWKLTEPDGKESFFARASSWLKVTLSRTGVYTITGRDLEAAGVALPGIEPRTLALYTLGEHVPNGPYPDSLFEIPLCVRGEEDGVFDVHDRILFYGQAAQHWLARCSAFVGNLYTERNVYWLGWGGRPGRRMGRRFGLDSAAAPVVSLGREVVHQEEDLECPARSGLLWVWSLIAKDAYREAASFDIDLDLFHPVLVRRIRGRLLSVTASNEVQIHLNNRPVGGFVFGSAPPNAPFDFALDTTLVVEFERNVLTLELRGRGEKSVYLDFLEVEYDRRLSLHAGQLHFLHDSAGTYRFLVRDVADTCLAFDITNPLAPKTIERLEMTGDSGWFCLRLDRPAEFAVAAESQLLKPERLEVRHPGRLADGGLRADYWVVAPEDLRPPCERLARYRTGRVAGIAGATARVAALELIYDDYSFGLEEPGAVKYFFADKRPAYGLLVGDATYDYKNNLGRETSPGVPAYEVGYGLDPGGTSSREALGLDAWYADFEGQGGSPDMILGRVTARGGAEMNGFVDKLMAYEAGPTGFWNKRFILLADDEFMGVGKPDPIGFGHVEYCEALAVLPGGLMQPVKVYLTEFPFVEVKKKPGADAALLRELNRGGLLWVFFGHGDAFDLTHESVLSISRVNQIDCGDRLPFAYFGSCSVGRFEDTRYECIAEELVRMPRSGAIASIGATKATTAQSNLVFARNLLVPLFGLPESTLGVAFFSAWPTDRIYHLFGDPATVLRLPRPSTQSLLVSPDSLVPGGQFRARSVIEVREGRFHWALFAPWRTRRYVSTRGVANYVLPGDELARGSGCLDDGRLVLQGVYPLGMPTDTLFVGDGYYAPVRNSARLCASVWADTVNLSVLRDTIAGGSQPAQSGDQIGPEVSLWADGRRLQPGAAVRASFELEGVLSDQSGILIAPVRGATPRFFVNNGESEVELADRLVFDNGSSTTARFRVQVKLDGQSDTLWVAVCDNLLNRATLGTEVRPQSSDDALELDSVLVCPNPVQSDAHFTFKLSRPASVRVRVFSLGGRLVCDLGEQSFGFGYSQIHWDGRDQERNRPGNGIYLFTITARALAAGGSQQASARDRFIVLR